MPAAPRVWSSQSGSPVQGSLARPATGYSAGRIVVVGFNGGAFSRRADDADLENRRSRERLQTRIFGNMRKQRENHRAADHRAPAVVRRAQAPHVLIDERHY